jgi:hypothetical protein
MADLWGDLASAAASYAGYKASNDAAHGQQKSADQNAKIIAAENQKNRDFALQLLNMSRPQISPTDLGNMLFAQNEQQYQKQQGIQLQSALRQNLRAGSPVSGADITGAMINDSAKTLGDRRVDATLKGITGTLPGAAAIQSAANLYSPSQLPLTQYIPNYSVPNALGLLGLSLNGQGNNQATIPNTTLGNQ